MNEAEIKKPIERIKQLLKQEGLTQQDLADRIGCTLQNVKNTLNPSASSINTKNLKRYADALDVPMWKLFASPDEAIEPPQIIAQFYFKGQMFFATTFLEVRGLVDNLENQLMEMERNLQQPKIIEK